MKRTTATSTTSDWDPLGGRGEPAHPVRAIYRLPNGPTWDLEQITNARRQPVNRVVIGSGISCDIGIYDQREDGQRVVSAQHCILHRTREGRVFVQRHPLAERKYIKVNKTRSYDGRIELGPGDLIHLRRVQLAALGDELVGYNITARDVDEYLRRAVRAHGDIPWAAAKLNIAVRTLRRWLDNGRFRTHKA